MKKTEEEDLSIFPEIHPALIVPDVFERVQKLSASR